MQCRRENAKSLVTLMTKSKCSRSAKLKSKNARRCKNLEILLDSTMRIPWTILTGLNSIDPLDLQYSVRSEILQDLIFPKSTDRLINRRWAMEKMGRHFLQKVALKVPMIHRLVRSTPRSVKLRKPKERIYLQRKECIASIHHIRHFWTVSSGRKTHTWIKIRRDQEIQDTN